MAWGIESLRAERIALLELDQAGYNVELLDAQGIGFAILDRRMRKIALDVLDLKEAWVLSSHSQVQKHNVRQMKEDLSEAEVPSGMEVFLRIAKLSVLYFLFFFAIAICIFDFK